MKKVIICGGHLTPALALVEELQKEKNLQIIFFGRKYSTEGSKNLSAEYQIIKNKNIKFYSIFTGRFQRKFTKYTLFSLLKIPFGFLQTLILLAFLRPKIIVSFGGYLSFPIIFNGWLLGIGSSAHEQTTIPGLANKLNSLFVKKIFLSWPKTKKYFEKEKCQIIGNLVQKAIFKTQASSKEISQFLKKAKNLIYVTGGNQGSHFLNSLIFNSQDELKNFSILHQVGTANYKGDFDKAQKIKKNNYLAVDYVHPQDIGAVFNKASVVISRSGANTVWELALLAKPAILVPLPVSSGSEQEENAKILENAGFAKILEQKDLTPALLFEKVNIIFKNYQKYQKLALIFQKTLPRDAAKKLTDQVLRYT